MVNANMARLGNTNAKRRWVEIDGIRDHIDGWSERLKIHDTLMYRMAKKHGISIEGYLSYKYYCMGKKFTKAAFDEFIKRIEKGMIE